MATPAPLDADRIVRTLHAHGVACVVVGGIAANLHGALRPTKDFDFVAHYDRDNLKRLAAAMRELGAYIRTDGYVDDATLEASKHLVHEDHLARTEISTWNSDAGPFDVLRDIPTRDGGHLSYDDLVEHATEFEHPTTGLVVRVAALDDVVASKEWAKRPKDRQALPELYRLRDAQRDNPDHGRRPNRFDPPGTQSRSTGPPEPDLDR